ncbi:hypothetical protein [Aliamphritea spongicola]|uniref:hypothetical protein n=1 Tax=Aliamphritea spongicola TaxID=707589 RepID=UPI00196A3EEB|nr:hypothetical protein [Aliamphritea spongicola]MBN3564846.1 hypothetical protein [Aliamphritea spongicola]
MTTFFDRKLSESLIQIGEVGLVRRGEDVRFISLFLIAILSGCASVDGEKEKLATAVPVDDVAAEEPVAKVDSSVEYIHLFDVLQRYPKSGLGIFEDWVIVKVNTADEKAIWSFPPVYHPAYPAAVRREIINSDGSIRIHTHMNCAAAEALCELLFRDFIAMSEKVLGGS